MLINAVNGATWVHGGVGIGYFIHAGQVIVTDGTAEVEARLRRILTSDSFMIVIRNADAGYMEAEKTACKPNFKRSMRSS